MSDSKKKQPKATMSGDDFIKFISSATPEEVSKLITEKGKPRKLIEGIIYYDNPDEKA